MVSGLYQVSVPVEDQSSASRDQGLMAALQQVLVKVSGSTGVLQNPLVQQKISDSSSSYVKSFRYLRDEVDDSVNLRVIFAQGLIDKLLRDTGQPIWGKSRPLILTWLALEQGNGRQIVNQNAEPARLKMIESAMNDRGLPLLWPALDLDDELALPVQKLWGLFSEDIGNASARYQADAVLAGRLVPSGSQQWLFRGLLLHDQQEIPLEAQGDDAAAVLAMVADQVAGYFASRYAVKTDGLYLPEGHQLTISGVRDFRDYYQLLSYLRARVAINDVQLLQADQQQLTLALDLAADWSQVWRLLALDKRLVAQPDSDILVWQP